MALTKSDFENFKGKKVIFHEVQVFPDIKVQYTDRFPDVKLQEVERFQDFEIYVD